MNATPRIPLSFLMIFALTLGFAGCVEDVEEEQKMPAGHVCEAIAPYDNEQVRSDIRVDNAGEVHFVRSQQDQSDYPWAVYYSKRTGGWPETGIASTSFDAGDISLAVDASGTAHVAYLDGQYPETRVHYATNAGGSWASETVDAVPYVSVRPDIVLGPAGAPHVAYIAQHDSTQELRVARLQAEAWTIEVAAETGDGNDEKKGTYPAAVYSGLQADVHVAVDSTGAVHAVCLGETAAPDFGMVYAHKQTGQWQNEFVDLSAAQSLIGFEIDPGGAAHAVVLTMADSAAYDLVYLTQDGDAWERNTIVPLLESWTDLPVMALDENAALHILYDSNDMDYYLTDASGQWETTELVIKGRVIRGPVIDVADNKVHMGFNDWHHYRYFGFPAGALKPAFCK